MAAGVAGQSGGLRSLRPVHQGLPRRCHHASSCPMRRSLAVPHHPLHTRHVITQSILQLRTTHRNNLRRAHSSYGLSLLGLSAPNWQRVWCAGALSQRRCDDQWPVQAVRSRRRCRQSGNISLLPGVRSDSLLGTSRSRRTHCNSCRGFRRAGISATRTLGVRGAHAFLGQDARKHRAHSLTRCHIGNAAICVVCVALLM